MVKSINSISEFAQALISGNLSAFLSSSEFDLLIYFLSIDKCKFRRKVGPGDQLKLKVNILRGKIGSKVWKFSGAASVDGEIAAEVEFTAMMEFPS